jgi:hypothetical protein
VTRFFDQSTRKYSRAYHGRSVVFSTMHVEGLAGLRVVVVLDVEVALDRVAGHDLPVVGRLGRGARVLVALPVGAGDPFV